MKSEFLLKLEADREQTIERVFTLQKRLRELKRLIGAERERVRELERRKEVKG